MVIWIKLLSDIRFHQRSRITMENQEYTVFPEDFKFGAATSSHQIEGGWNEGGKGENVWDHLTHTKPESVIGKHNGDIACDSYHKYKEDIKCAKDLGVDCYRFSISWSRVLPTGFANKINPDGIRYYNELIDGLLAEGIEPAVTMFHWDLPQPLQNLGGWMNPALVDYFEDYARVLYENFGDRVKTWFTINEPWVISEVAYGYGALAPAVKSPGVGIYLCGENLLKAHAKAYRLYDEVFRSEQKGRVTLVIHWLGMIPVTDSPRDLALAEKAKQFKFGWFAHPVFSENGDYPHIMKESIAKKSAQQGFPRSRLPELGDYWVNFIRGTADFIAINTYSSFYACPLSPDEEESGLSWCNDIGARLENEGRGWPDSTCYWLKENPVEFGNMFRWIRKEYGDREIVITENGWADSGSTHLDDYERIRYTHRYLKELLTAIHRDKIRVTGYFHWSLIDNFEWLTGYTSRMGLHRVDFDHPDRPRMIKASGRYYKELIRARKLPENVNEEVFARDKRYCSKTYDVDRKETILFA
ncbi:myrosinase 1-like isoform X1 [Athalia rosae]|uniref:myrosinase 1-like isoform X1 n=2 Tax=Athalia rosae TaxID=37344 RepID=UPI00203343A5|nr:myrosinase 1-like isoform X1 [Athalia rosae]